VGGRRGGTPRAMAVPSPRGMPAAGQRPDGHLPTIGRRRPSCPASAYTRCPSTSSLFCGTSAQPCGTGPVVEGVAQVWRPWERRCRTPERWHRRSPPVSHLPHVYHTEVALAHAAERRANQHPRAYPAPMPAMSNGKSLHEKVVPMRVLSSACARMASSNRGCHRCMPASPHATTHTPSATFVIDTRGHSHRTTRIQHTS
jgi:hypothetical protein